MSTSTQVKDPVCGMAVAPESAAGTAGYAGETYHFCSAACKQRFEADPRAYVGGDGEPSPAAPAPAATARSSCRCRSPA